jgi:hypothetical protein
VDKDNVIEFIPLGERGEVVEMRKSLLKVDDEPHAMAPRELVQSRIVFLAERIADILDQVEIADADRQSLLWHLSLIRELAVDRKRGIVPLCSLPRFDPPPGGAA